MNLKRTTTIVVVGAALIAWLAGAATSNHAIPPPPAVQSTTIEARGAELAGEIARLHERLRPTATPSQPARNLFAFRAMRAPASAAPLGPAPAPKAALTELAPAPVAGLPPLKLAGIAEDAGPDGPVRIAFIAGEGQLFMVKEGEKVSLRYRVTKISADVVELVDLGDNSTRRLALR
jgi:hypothetical protein